MPDSDAILLGVNRNPSKTDECPPNSFKRKVNGLIVTFRKRPLDGLELKRSAVEYNAPLSTDKTFAWEGVHVELTAFSRHASQHNDSMAMYNQLLIIPYIIYMPPKRRFWKTKQRVGRVFSRHFARGRRPNRVLTPDHLFRFPKSMLPKRRFWKTEPTFPIAPSRAL